MVRIHVSSVIDVSVDAVWVRSRDFVQWNAQFDCGAGREREWAELIGDGVFQGGLDASKSHLARALSTHSPEHP